MEHVVVGRFRERDDAQNGVVGSRTNVLNVVARTTVERPVGEIQIEIRSVHGIIYTTC